MEKEGKRQTPSLRLAFSDALRVWYRTVPVAILLGLVAGAAYYPLRVQMGVPDILEPDYLLNFKTVGVGFSLAMGPATLLYAWAIPKLAGSPEPYVKVLIRLLSARLWMLPVLWGAFLLGPYAIAPGIAFVLATPTLALGTDARAWYRQLLPAVLPIGVLGVPYLMFSIVHGACAMFFPIGTIALDVVDQAAILLMFLVLGAWYQQVRAIDALGQDGAAGEPKESHV